MDATRRFRAPAAARWRVAALAVVAVLASAPGAADAPRPEPLRLAGAAPAVSSEGVLVEHLGVALGDGRMAPVLRAGQPCRFCERTVDYSTAVDGQTEIPILLLRGRATGPGEARPVAAVQIVGVAPAPAGRGHVRVTLGIDGADVWVAARDAASGRALAVVGRVAGARSSESPAAPAPAQ
ncbi:MAG: hypothetical protein ACQGVK_07485 [Myxococcota bacterium]